MEGNELVEANKKLREEIDNASRDRLVELLDKYGDFTEKELGRMKNMFKSILVDKKKFPDPHLGMVRDYIKFLHSFNQQFMFMMLFGFGPTGGAVAVMDKDGKLVETVDKDCYADLDRKLLELNNKLEEKKKGDKN